MLNGRIDIRYRRVECTPPVPVKVQIDGNSGPGGWLRLSVTVSGLHLCTLCSVVFSSTICILDSANLQFVNNLEFSGSTSLAAISCSGLTTLHHYHCLPIVLVLAR